MKITDKENIIKQRKALLEMLDAWLEYGNAVKDCDDVKYEVEGFIQAISKRIATFCFWNREGVVKIDDESFSKIMRTCRDGFTNENLFHYGAEGKADKAQKRLAKRLEYMVNKYKI